VGGGWKITMRTLLLSLAWAALFGCSRSGAEAAPAGAVVQWGNTHSSAGFSTGAVHIAGQVLTDAVALAAGGTWTLALRSDGTVAGWGWDYQGNVTGLASDKPQFTNAFVSIRGQILSNVTAIAAGRGHSLALKSDGSVAEWGEIEGGKINNTLMPPGISGIAAVSAGLGNSLALKRDGRVIGWGYPPVPNGLTNVAAISAARAFRGPNLALMDDGTVIQWTSDVDAAVVPGLSNITAIASGAYHWLALRRDGRVVQWLGDTNPPAEVPGLSNIVAVAAGNERLSMALRGDGTVAAWGGAPFARATVPTGLTNVVAIAAGDALCLAITTNAASLKAP
jgi:trimeric autotransporter adhesin